MDYILCIHCSLFNQFFFILLVQRRHLQKTENKQNIIRNKHESISSMRIKEGAIYFFVIPESLILFGRMLICLEVHFFLRFNKNKTCNLLMNV